MSTQRILTRKEVAERKEAINNWYIPANQMYAMSANGTIVAIENTFDARVQFRSEDLFVSGAGR
jgi:1,2-phenylacetyl-CoA epoxidase catalytic subunit